MKRCICVLLLVLFAMPLLAQEEMAPPKPLNDDLFAWLVGEWDGTMDSPMGESKDWAKYEMGLDGQFLFMQATSETNGMMYKGMGAMTLNPQSGAIIGSWIDNFRGMYEGSGTRDGNKIVIEWDGTMGKSTRITEKLSADKFRETVKMTGPDGNAMEFSGEYTRKKAASKTD